jgi:hypothetical protein
MKSESKSFGISNNLITHQGKGQIKPLKQQIIAAFPGVVRGCQ